MSDYTPITPEAALTRRLEAFDQNLAELRSELEAVAAKYAAIKERLDRPPIILYTPLDLLRWVADGDLRMTEEGWIFRGWKIEPDRDGTVQWMGTEENYTGPPDPIFTGDTPDEVLELIVNHEEGKR